MSYFPCFMLAMYCAAGIGWMFIVSMRSVLRYRAGDHYLVVRVGFFPLVCTCIFVGPLLPFLPVATWQTSGLIEIPSAALIACSCGAVLGWNWVSPWERRYLRQRSYDHATDQKETS